MKQPALFAFFWRVIIIQLAISAFFPVLAVAQECPDGAAQHYWTSFRSAALSGNIKAVARVTRFPFAKNHTLDDDGTQHLTRQGFIAAFPSLLKADPGLSAEPTTMKSLLKTTPRLSQSFCNAQGNQLRVGTWVFEHTPGGWQFVQAFVDE